MKRIRYIQNKDLNESPIISATNSDRIVCGKFLIKRNSGTKFIWKLDRIEAGICILIGEVGTKSTVRVKQEVLLIKYQFISANLVKNK